MAKFTVTHPDGTVSTRNSKTRVYTHAVEIKDARGYGVVRWSKNADLAEKNANTWRNCWAVSKGSGQPVEGATFRVVPVD